MNNVPNFFQIELALFDIFSKVSYIDVQWKNLTLEAIE